MGGIASALCLLLMMLTIIPIATYTMPALAGMVLIVVVIENGYSTAWMVYAAVGFLSLFICPDKEAAMLFVGFFGYYPILKGKLEKIKKRSMEYLSKFSIFNLAMILNYLVIIYLFGIQDILEDVGPLGKFSVLLLLLMGNVVFLSMTSLCPASSLLIVWSCAKRYSGGSGRDNPLKKKSFLSKFLLKKRGHFI